MTQIDPGADVDGDALTRPFTPGAASNDPALAEFTETTGPVDIQIVDPETREFVEEWRNGRRQGHPPAAMEDLERADR